MGERSQQVTDSRAALILAGGDGMRLRSLTRFISGGEIPKQFCAVASASTLLEETLARVALMIPEENTIVVVNRAHREFYRPLLRRWDRQHVVEQPANCGTAPAILYGLRRLTHLGRDATVTVFPCDHFVSDGPRFMSHVRRSWEAIDRHPELAVLLGIVPASAETSFGWIEPAEPVDPDGGAVSRVKRFWEKPQLSLALKLWRAGCLWNSFVITARAPVFHSMTGECASQFFASFNAALTATDIIQEEAAADRLYAELAPVGFSEGVLAACPPNLAVIPVDDVDWNDLGEPGRVVETLAQCATRPEWIERYLREDQVENHY